ncbi:TPA: hypothetical protein N0F65_005159 [Lagenidium giganteum]|uniref:Kri1-like C-terminal domain-containing protein n=1 Tax=Lagenidium giganteum TaxID=4803 RepID=A0AAV2YXG6_9STRA|nr:TPA: hypothetical protein N0F65_005159 [Lagenidium giganteum]
MGGVKKDHKKAKPAAKSAKKPAKDDEKELSVLKRSKAAKPTPFSDASDGDDDDNDQITELQVNEKFAKAFEERKRKEELTKLEKRGVVIDEEDDDESDSETEDEDGEHLTAEVDADIRKTLQLIRKKDPAIYDQSITFFKKDEEDSEEDDESSDDDEAVSKAKGKKKASKEKAPAPMYYKDLVRQQVIAGDIDSEEEEEDRSENNLSYAEEQAKIKANFLRALKGNASEAEDNDDDDDDDDQEGGLFKLRKKTDSEQQKEDEEFESFKAKNAKQLSKDDIDPDAFLEHYVSSEAWKEKKNVIPHYEDIVREDEEDEEELEKAEEFEHSYNFRFEEEGGGMINTYSRHIEGSMRREDDTRKRKRAERKERKALERQKKEEELRRLKNLKQAEIQSKLNKVAKLMGKAEAEKLKVQPSDLEAAFDPEEYDKRMQEIFDEEYYNEDDVDMEKPTWDDEEDKELFGNLPVDPEEEEETAADDDDDAGNDNEEEKDSDDEAGDEEHANGEDAENDDEDGDEEEDEGDVDEKPLEEMTLEEMKAAKQKYLDEMYALDYEDLIGDLRCRFKYRHVPKNDFGLSIDDILVADDKELKQLVSLKRIAPFVDHEFQVDRRKLKQFKKQVVEPKKAQYMKKAKEDQTGESGEAETVAEAPEVDTEKKSAAAVEGTATGATKKRKRNKKGKKDATVEEKPAAPVEEAPAEKETTEEPKKKKRRSKKKKTETNAYSSTGLSTSRLESYKLAKPAKK